MTGLLGRGECGGHVTLLFTVSDEVLDPVGQGSLGAGLCVDDGVEVVAYGEQGEFGLKVSFEGTEGDSRLYDSVLGLLVEEIPEAKGITWEIGVRLTLPISRRYIRIGSSIISDASKPFCHAAAISDSVCFLPPASFFGAILPTVFLALLKAPGLMSITLRALSLPFGLSRTSFEPLNSTVSTEPLSGSGDFSSNSSLSFLPAFFLI